jgi:CHAT domain-containing protein/tetratricopeptide (TPR) repeat protein
MRRRLIAACGLAFAVAGCKKGPDAAASPHGGTGLHSNAQADSILTLGEAAYHRSEYDSAESILSAGRALAVASGDSQSVARADTWRGLTAMKQGIHASARALGESALAMKLRLGLKADLFRSYNALGLLAWLEGRYSDAQTLFAQARSSAEAEHDTVSLAKAVGNLGLVHSEIGDFQQARTEFAVLERVAHQSKDAKSEGNALSNRGMVETRDGNPTEAILWLQRARPLYAFVSSPDGEESVLGQLGSAYAMMDQPQKAIAYMDSAISVARSHDLVREQAEDLQIYAELLGEAGDHQAALRHLANARLLADSAGLGSRAGDIAGAQARELVSISRNDLALERAEEAAAIHLKAGAKLEEMEDRLLVAEIAEASHKGDKAQDELAQARKIASTLATPVASENVSLGTARVADLAADPAAVLRALPTDAAFPRMGESAAGEAEALRARAFARLRQWPEAVSAGQRAIASLELVRQGLGEGPLRAAFTSDKSQVYADLVIALLHLGRSSDAFEVADAARGKALLEHLSAMRGSVRASAGDLAEADRILRRIDYLTEKLRGADTARSTDRAVPMRRDLRDLADKLALARKQYEDRVSTVARTDPRGATLLGIDPVHAVDIRKTLLPNEVLVEYLATDQRLLIFAATRDTVLSASSVISLDDLANRVRLASELLRKSTTPRAGHEVMRALYDVLMDPVEKMKILRPGSTIIVVPHSALAYLPFAALVQPDGKLLVESYPLLELPSAAALPRLRSEVSSALGGSAVFAPFPDELAGTRDEAVAVSRMTPKAATYFGGRATERQVRAALATSGIVHIASHALLDQINPLFSHVELAAAARSSPDDDGSLAVHELLEIPVHSELVYLSGCETGAGASWSTSFRRSQDYATLSQAMLYAGAQNVVATLWRIDDAGASVFARRFYAALSSTDPVDAIAIAQRGMIRDARYAAPRYWAGYTISGSGEMKMGPQSHRTVAVK